MLIFLTRLKQRYAGSAEFRKYVLYALGEMLLLIVGVLVALQVDNWNSERLEQQSLRQYLQAIARNIDSDLDSINSLRAAREQSYELSLRWTEFSRRANTYSVEEVAFGSRVLEAAVLLRQFSSTRSGYEALLSSGTLAQIQGTDLEKLLYDYYDTVARIEQLERNHNEFTRLKSMEFYSRWPSELVWFELEDPGVLTASRFAELQPMYRRLYGSFMTNDLMRGMQTVAGPLVREYDSLNRIGLALSGMIRSGSQALGDEKKAMLGRIYDPAEGVGYPELITNGQVFLQAYGIINSDANDRSVSDAVSSERATSPFTIDSFVRSGDSLNIAYEGGVAWGGIWLIVTTGPARARGSADYSGYDTLVLEMKGATGGESLVVNLEDVEDPADGSSTRVELQLSDEWQTYEIDLERFETADLEILRAALGFIFFEEPLSFSIRTAKFAKAE